ncbi:stage IV sporulation protein A [Clostridiisalibacter paucivorans]|uniref:stage IV sporulation protein A n=1 Tax=Clostridiisalibacter paucivorans TaxID=408753 RepID=UPI00047D0E46|nr:stage IV sporulation protein A [Clostridiisalibacter paucivorans]
MDNFDIYRDISERTNGDIYLGVVGPVRTGKSTFIKRFMDLLVIPNIENTYQRERAKDELPQSGMGKTITTTEPKFVPNEAVEIIIRENAKLKIRMVDCVGYLVKGVLGHEENNMPRMVNTPWFEKEIPFEEAAEIGTRKVITDHSTIGVVVTTDGSITDIERPNYVKAEERVVEELKELDKPFVVLLNSKKPKGESTIALKENLTERYGVPVIPVDCMNMSMEDINSILEKILFEFPVKEINISLPGWIEGLYKDHWIRKDILKSIREKLGLIYRISDIDTGIEELTESEVINETICKEINLGEGIVDLNMLVEDHLLYDVISDTTGYDIKGEHQLMTLISKLAKAKEQYDRIEGALEDVKNFGYGLVPPTIEELELLEPETFKEGNRFGVKLKANAPSLHIMRVDINTEVSPVIGTEKQSEQLVKHLLEDFESDPTKIWQSNMFGKSLNDLVQEQLEGKLNMMPEDARRKMRKTLQRIVNDGSGGLICIII